MLVGTLVQTLVLLFITLRTDWEKQVGFIIFLLIFFLILYLIKYLFHII
jgi:hypothetical protein